MKMKVSDIKTWIVGTPSGQTNWIFLKLITDDGIEGVGECTNYSYMDFTIERCICAHNIKTTELAVNSVK